MTITFRPAERENVSLILGLAGGTGSGKTWSAYELAKGLSGGKRFAVIDTESGRGKHYADHFDFDHADLDAPFSPAHYIEAIEAADKAGYPVIIVDSASHSHAGEGGMLDQQEEELQRMAGSDWKKREACKMAAWVKPKQEMKRMIYRLLRLRSHLILCFRAEEKTEMVKDDKGKWQVVPKTGPGGFKGWVPICEKTLPYELTASFLLLPDKPGVPHPIKLPEDLKPLVPLGETLSTATGERLAKWASGGANKAPTPEPDEPSSEVKAHLAGIKVAADHDELDAIGLKIKQSKNLSDAEKSQLRKAWSDRQGELDYE